MKNTMNVLQAMSTVEAMELAGIPREEIFARLIANNNLEPVGTITLTAPMKGFIKEWYGYSTSTETHSETVEKETPAVKELGTIKTLRKFAEGVGSKSTGEIVETVQAVGTVAVVKTGGALKRGAFIEAGGYVAGIAEEFITGSKDFTTTIKNGAHILNGAGTTLSAVKEVKEVLTNQELAREINSTRRVLTNKTKDVAGVAVDRVRNWL